MSHCPGSRLEDWVTDWYRVVDADGKHGTGIRRFYEGQLILSKEQFDQLLKIHEPIRERIEHYLQEYSEEENGSWRDYCSVFSDVLTDDIRKAAESLLKTLEQSVQKTPGIFGK